MGNSMWFTRRALRLHLTLIVVFPGCLALGWWQMNVALSGNTLSWVYTFEWPGFAIYALYMWWRLLHDEVDQTQEVDGGRALPQVDAGKAGSANIHNTADVANPVDTDQGTLPGWVAFDPLAKGIDVPGTANHGQVYEGVYENMYEDEELAAYNRYLAELNNGTSRISR
ncbi:MAG: hypothetical protein ACYDGY_01215 [Acidimicrobiales bacterium]